MDRRAVFFLVASVVVVALAPALPEDSKHPVLHDVAPVLAVACVVLALLSWLDRWSRRRHQPPR